MNTKTTNNVKKILAALREAATGKVIVQDVQAATGLSVQTIFGLSGAFGEGKGTPKLWDIDRKSFKGHQILVLTEEGKTWEPAIKETKVHAKAPVLSDDEVRAALAEA